MKLVQGYILLKTTDDLYIPLHDGVEIIANDQGNRTTPSYVAFTVSKRLIGDAAKNQVAMKPTNTVFGAKYFSLLVSEIMIIVLKKTSSHGIKGCTHFGSRMVQLLPFYNCVSRLT